MTSLRAAVDPDAVSGLHALLQAGRELGPERDRDLVALYLDRHMARSPHSDSRAPALLRPGVVPAQVLAGHLALAAGVERLVAALSAPGEDAYRQVAETLTILCVADLAAFAAGLGLIAWLAACGARTWRSGGPLRAALGPALATLAGAAVVEGLALAARAQYTWSSDFLLGICAIAFVFFLAVACCSLAPCLARAALRGHVGEDPRP